MTSEFSFSGRLLVQSVIHESNGPLTMSLDRARNNSNQLKILEHEVLERQKRPQLQVQFPTGKGMTMKPLSPLQKRMQTPSPVNFRLQVR